MALGFSLVKLICFLAAAQEELMHRVASRVGGRAYGAAVQPAGCGQTLFFVFFLLVGVD